MLDKCSVYNVLAEAMYFLDKCIFLDKSSQSNFDFLNFSLLVWSCLKPGVSFCINFAPCCKNLAKTYISVKDKWNFPETPIQSIQRSLNLLFQRTLFLMFPLFQKYLNPQFRTNKLVNTVVYHFCPSILASGIHPFTFL